MFCHKLHAFFKKKILTSFRKKIARNGDVAAENPNYEWLEGFQPPEDIVVQRGIYRGPKVVQWVNWVHKEVEAMQIEFDGFCMPLSWIDDALRVDDQVCMD